METFSLQTAAQQLKEKKARVEASVPKLELEVKFNPTGFCNYLHQRVDILVASKGSALNPGSSFEQEVLNAMSVYQIPLVNEINEAFNLQGIFPFAGVFSMNIPQPISSAIFTEDSLQVIGQKLLQKKAQVEASLGGLPLEVRINLIGFYEYLLQRIDILAVAGGSIPDPVVYLQEEIAKAISLYHVPLTIALTEAFNLQAVFLRENREHGQPQALSPAGASSVAATQTENKASSGIVARLEVEDIKSEPNSDVEEQMPDGAGDSPPGRVNPNRRPSGPIKEEIMDDNPLAVALYQPPAGQRVDSGSMDGQEENYLDDDDESDNGDVTLDEESDYLEEEEMLMSDEDSFADDDGNDINEDSIMDDNDEGDADENMSDSEEDQQNDNQEVSIDGINYEEDGEEVEEAQPVLDIAGPSSMTLRRSTRNSARVTHASSGQEHQENRRVSKQQTIAGRSSNGRNVEVEPLSIITKKLKCTVPRCKKVVMSKSALNGHLLSVHKLKRYRCLVGRCYGKVSTSFTTKTQFSDHLDLVHGRTTRLACKCSKKFKSYKELSLHYWQYHELGQFACSKDGCSLKPTSTRVKVQIHLYNHLEAKFECPFDGCDRSFKKKSHLDVHTLTHTGERPFACPECDKSFNRKDHLTGHLRMHRSDKCYRCTWPQCAYSSTNRSHVITHIRTVHFELPKTKRQQVEEEIEDDRDARVYVAKD